VSQEARPIFSPTWKSELRRGFNSYNLFVSALASIALGLVFLGLTAMGVVPGSSFPVAAAEALLLSLVLFVAIAAVHAMLHAYFGWRLGRGVSAFVAGDFDRAKRLLAILERRGIEHYDPGSGARAALQQLRSRSRSG